MVSINDVKIDVPESCEVNRESEVVMKLGSLFDGIGGWPLAATKMQIDPVWASEIEPFPIEVTKRHFPGMKHLGDITTINGAEIEPVDIICMGSPCQDLSIAGKREGLSGSRSGLFMDAIRIVREMREATNGKYPRFVVWENVPGAFSSNKGNDFRAVLEEITESQIPMPESGRWAKAGMVRSKGCEVAWRTLDAQYWGVPQRRKRIFLVADFGGGCAAEILFEPESMSGNLETGGSKGESITGDIKDMVGTPIWDIGDRRRVSESIDISPTLLSKMGTGGNNVPIVTDSTRAAIGGVDRYNQAFLPELAQTLRSAEGGDSTPTVLAPVTKEPVTFSVGNLVRGADAAPDNSGVCKTLRADMGDQRPCICLNDQGGQSIKNPQCVYKNGYKVRRLTPTECERLQGLPDGYTAGGSDSARYKALGNGMAQPCADFIIRRIKEEADNCERQQKILLPYTC